MLGVLVENLGFYLKCPVPLNELAATDVTHSRVFLFLVDPNFPVALGLYD